MHRPDKRTGHRRSFAAMLALTLVPALYGCDNDLWQAWQVHRDSLRDCETLVHGGFRPISDERIDRFLGKVSAAAAGCRGGERARRGQSLPFVDWRNYWGAGDVSSLLGELTPLHSHLKPNQRGIDGALIDMEYSRIELIRFNLFDNTSFPEYLRGRGGVPGPNLTTWSSMRLPPDHPQYRIVGGEGVQLCRGELIRYRNLSGICNDLRNPLMGSSNQLFARNVEFEETFPRLGQTELVRNRHGNRIALLRPDPQLISRRLFSRPAAGAEDCQGGTGISHCSYKAAAHLNVLAAFWIQFMNHDWFSHLSEGENGPGAMTTGCFTQPGHEPEHGCRHGDLIGPARIADDIPAPRFDDGGRSYLARAPRTTRNTVTAWWDASQIYGYDDISVLRVKRDPADRARLALVDADPGHSGSGYLPLLHGCGTTEATANCRPDPMHPAWAGQEAVAFPDNWSIGLSFFHNLFAREHNIFVDEFRKFAAAHPDSDSGLRNPASPDTEIPYRNVTDDELFQIARLVIAAEIAKIHTLEWTTQLLYDEPLYQAMRANWSGLLGDSPLATNVVRNIVLKNFGQSSDDSGSNEWYSVLAAGSGIIGMGSRIYPGEGRFSLLNRHKTDLWNLANLEQVNGGTNHFGAPFNFPEEFVSVYRLHPLLPDLLEYRNLQDNPNVVRESVPLSSLVRAAGTRALRERGLINWALSLGRQRLGQLALQNHPRFLQDLAVPWIPSTTGRIDVAALDIIRDRERGITRYNEFRRQIGLKQLDGFDTLVGAGNDSGAERKNRLELASQLRDIYGQHRCDASKTISHAQRDDNNVYVNDCLGHADGSMVDNIEDLDLVVGWLAESTRPHGFAISETQFQIFALNASRRLLSDRFFTSSYRAEFYTQFGMDWIRDNGPGGVVMEDGSPNGHAQEVSALKRVLLRALPELQDELEPVVNVFDPWARDRGEYYSLQWRPRSGAKTDDSFRLP